MSQFPSGFDQQALEKLQQSGVAERDRRFRAAHQDFLEKAKREEQGLSLITGSLGMKSQNVEHAMAAKRKETQALVRQAQPTPFKPPKGHNPVRYAPFDSPYSAIDCGGITECTLRGPNTETGEIGADLDSFNAGGASAVASVGFWYYSQQEGTLYITAQAWIWGVGHIFSGLFGYASAYCGLRAYIEEYTDSGLNVYTSITDIYNNSSALAFDITNFDWVSRTVSIAVPTRANTWYTIWTDDVQSVYASGIADAVSNFDMYVGPVAYFTE